MVNEKRLIDANAVIKEIDNYYHNSPFPHPGTTWLEGLELAVGLLLREPTVEAVEVVHGRWIERPLDNFRKYEVKCSECGFVGIGNYDQYLEPYDFNYCPICGAKMDGDGNADV